MSDAISILKEQHKAVTALFMKLERAQTPQLRAQIFRTIDSELRGHSAIEEKIFYPAFKEHARNQSQVSEVQESFHEHAEMKAAIEAVERVDPAGREFAHLAERLKRLVLHHSTEEEHGMLRQAHKVFTVLELQDIGFRMEEAARSFSPVYEMAGPATAL